MIIERFVTIFVAEMFSKVSVNKKSKKSQEKYFIEKVK